MCSGALASLTALWSLCGEAASSATLWAIRAQRHSVIPLGGNSREHKVTPPPVDKVQRKRHWKRYLGWTACFFLDVNVKDCLHLSMKVCFGPFLQQMIKHAKWTSAILWCECLWTRQQCLRFTYQYNCNQTGGLNGHPSRKQVISVLPSKNPFLCNKNNHMYFLFYIIRSVGMPIIGSTTERNQTLQDHWAFHWACMINANIPLLHLYMAPITNGLIGCPKLPSEKAGKRYAGPGQTERKNTFCDMVSKI